jgi:hypothetical protein
LPRVWFDGRGVRRPNLRAACDWSTDFGRSPA